MADIVLREKGGDIDVHREKVADRVLVLGSIEPPERVGSSRIGMGRIRAIEGCFEMRDHRVVRRFVRPRASGRRHHAPAQFAHDFFPRFGVVARPFRMKRRERQAGSLYGVVVAADAVAVEGRLRRHGGTRRTGRLFGRLLR